MEVHLGQRVIKQTEFPVFFGRGIPTNKVANDKMLYVLSTDDLSRDV